MNNWPGNPTWENLKMKKPRAYDRSAALVNGAGRLANPAPVVLKVGVDVVLMLNFEPVDFVLKIALHHANTLLVSSGFTLAAGAAFVGAGLGTELTVVGGFLTFQKSIKFRILLIDLILVGLLYVGRFLLFSIFPVAAIIVAPLTVPPVGGTNIGQIIRATDRASAAVTPGIGGLIIATRSG